VEDLPRSLTELARVLKPGGTMLHILPSSSWRFWSTLAEFVAGPRNTWLGVRSGPFGDWSPMARWQWTIVQLAWMVRPFLLRPHGACGCALTELWTFSRRSWRRRFAAYGCDVVAVVPLKLWYTGEVLLGSRLAVSVRTMLASWLGSATILYVVRPDSRTGNT
jgi:hypothetical protein